MPETLRIRPMIRAEVDELVEWAAREGWNPGAHDAELFWAADPDAFIAAEVDGQLAGGGAITSYGGEFGFMGLFIVRPEFRGRGFGDTLWHARRDRLIARLRPGATIGLDGVFAMQEYYAAGGFVFSHRSMRFRADGLTRSTAGRADDGIVPLSSVPFAEVAAYDRRCFPAPRTSFLTAWIGQANALALGHRRHGSLSGFGVVRRCREGCKIGPLFADDAAAALALFGRLAAFAGEDPVFLDVPENNHAGIDLVRELQMAEVFGCARMYLGPPPVLASPLKSSSGPAASARQLVREQGGFLYTSDVYNDDLPYWLPGTPPLLAIPYTLLNNDARYLLSNGVSSSDEFFGLLRDAFDQLWQEGGESPKMMSVGLHGRISGHPARARAIARFLDYALGHDSVWICRREDLARHWMTNHPPSGEHGECVNA